MSDDSIGSHFGIQYGCHAEISNRNNIKLSKLHELYSTFKTFFTGISKGVMCLVDVGNSCLNHLLETL